MSVHYKFKSSLEYNTVIFDGVHIRVGDLKKSIVQQKKLGRNNDFDLQITNAQTKELYLDDSVLIPKNTSLVVARIPLTLQEKKARERLESNHHHQPGSINRARDATGESQSPGLYKLSQAVDLSSMDASEDEKIKAMMSQSTQDYDPSRYLRIRGASQIGQVPTNYRCYKCHQPGHWIRQCPFNQESLDIKKATGIPRSFMVPVEGPEVPGAMITPTGHFAVPAVDHEAYKEQKKEKQPEKPPPEEKPEIPEDLRCNVCSGLLDDAVLTPCCGESFCDECVRTVLLESEEHQCPKCKEKDVSPDTLIPNRFLRNAVNNFKNETGYGKKVEPVVTEPPPEPPVEEEVPAVEDSHAIEDSPAQVKLDESIDEVDVESTPDQAGIDGSSPEPGPPPVIIHLPDMSVPPPNLGRSIPSLASDVPKPIPPLMPERVARVTPVGGYDRHHYPPSYFSLPNFRQPPPPVAAAYMSVERGREHSGMHRGSPYSTTDYYPFGRHSGYGNRTWYNKNHHPGHEYRSYRTPPQGGRTYSHSSTIDDPLAAFQRLMREKDARDGKMKVHYSRHRHHSRSWSRSPRPRSFSRSQSRSPRSHARRTRSRSRSARKTRSRTRTRSPSRSRSNTHSFSPSVSPDSPTQHKKQQPLKPPSKSPPPVSRYLKKYEFRPPDYEKYYSHQSPGRGHYNEQARDYYTPETYSKYHDSYYGHGSETRHNARASTRYDSAYFSYEEQDMPPDVRDQKQHYDAFGDHPRASSHQKEYLPDSTMADEDRQGSPPKRQLTPEAKKEVQEETGEKDAKRKKRAHSQEELVASVPEKQPVPVVEKVAEEKKQKEEAEDEKEEEEEKQAKPKKKKKNKRHKSGDSGKHKKKKRSKKVVKSSQEANVTTALKAEVKETKPPSPQEQEVAPPANENKPEPIKKPAPVMMVVPLVPIPVMKVNPVVPVPELSKWEREETVPPARDQVTAKTQVSSRVVTPEVLKMAENAIFQKRHLQPKAASVSTEAPKTIKITVPSDRDGRSVAISGSRKSAKERLGKVVTEDTPKTEETKVQGSVEKPTSKELPEKKKSHATNKSKGKKESKHGKRKQAQKAEAGKSKSKKESKDEKSRKPAKKSLESSESSDDSKSHVVEKAKKKKKRKKKHVSSSDSSSDSDSSDSEYEKQRKRKKKAAHGTKKSKKSKRK